MQTQKIALDAYKLFSAFKTLEKKYALQVLRSVGVEGENEWSLCRNKKLCHVLVVADKKTLPFAFSLLCALAKNRAPVNVTVVESDSEYDKENKSEVIVSLTCGSGKISGGVGVGASGGAKIRFTLNGDDITLLDELESKCKSFNAKNFSVKTSRENKTLTTEVAFFDEGEIERFAVMTAHLTPYEKFTTEIIKVYNPVYQDYNALTLISELAPFEKSAPKLKYLPFIRSDGNSDVKLFVNIGVGEEQEHFLLTANVIKMMLDKENNKKWQKD